MAAVYLKRKIDGYLAAWKYDPNRKPLIVKGPRQVGKTESILRFAEDSYKNVVYINFVEEPKYKLITEDGYKTDDVCGTFHGWIRPSGLSRERQSLYSINCRNIPKLPPDSNFSKWMDGLI